MLNDNKYKISIIVPAYNIAEFLPRCLDSILDQTYKNLEIIVISDGSTDGTDDIIKKYALKDKRIVSVLKNNSGVSDTRNKGIKMASGDYIGFVDGDDYIEPEMFERLLSNAIEYDADISHCGYQMVFPTRVDYYYNTGKKVIQDNEKGVKDIIVGDYVEPGIWNKIYRRNILENITMQPDIKNNEDLLFNVYAFDKSKKSVYEDIPFYHYILRKNSAATSELNDNKVFDPIIVGKKIYEFSLKYNVNIQKNALGRYLGAIMISYRTICNNKSKREYIGRIKQYMKDSKQLRKKYKFGRRPRMEWFLFFNFTKLYVLIHKFYDKFISGNDNKYEVN